MLRDIATALLALLCFVSSALAERLPSTIFTTRDGLPHNTIRCVEPDSRGYLWFCTPEGLARFDGAVFRSYTTADGLPANSVTAIKERPDGTYWVAANDRLCLFDLASGQPRFRCEAPPEPSVIAAVVEDSRGIVWCGTDRGLWRRRVSGQAVQWEFVEALGSRNDGVAEVYRLLKDSKGNVWVGTESGLYRFDGDTLADRLTASSGLPSNRVVGISETADSIWASTDTHLVRIHLDMKAHATVSGRYDRSDGLPSGYATAVKMWQGQIWAATSGGLARTQNGKRWQSPESAAGMRGISTEVLNVDAYGNLWIGTDGAGAVRVSGAGFSSFSERDGLGVQQVASVSEDRHGELIVVTKSNDGYFVNRFDGERFHATRLEFPFGSGFGWSWGRIILQSPTSDWWVGTGDGLVRYRDGLSSLPERFLILQARIPENIFQLFEDSRRTLWISIPSGPSQGLYVRDHQTGTFKKLGSADGLPPPQGLVHVAAAFAEDRHDNLWVGLHQSTLLRFRNGRFTTMPPGSVWPEHGVRALLVDREGRLWVASRGNGLLRVDDPGAEIPSARAYGVEEGLSSSIVLAAAEDLSGRIYASTSQGIDRLDPESGRIRHFSTSDGVPLGEFQVAFRDRDGALWFGGDQGLTRLLPKEETSIPPAVVIHAVRVNDLLKQMSEIGDVEPNVLHLSSSERRVQVDFGGLRHDLRYQTRLTGVDRDWSAPSSLRTIQYLSLGAGTYEFAVRAVDADGVVSARPAIVRFDIGAPFYQTWWFRVLAVTLGAGLIYAGHLFLLERRLAIERMRSTIATDLHDDVGSSLARISVLSEVLMSGTAGLENSKRLEQLSAAARQLIEDMNDIVWSVDPRQDSLSDVVSRIRYFASEILDGKNIHWTFAAPDGLAGIRLTREQRRHLLLIFKEAITNIVRHADCTRVELEIRREHAHCQARIYDNGRGLPSVRPGGNGLTNMRRRAKLLKGELEITSAPGQGTNLTLVFPLK